MFYFLTPSLSSFRLPGLLLGLCFSLVYSCFEDRLQILRNISWVKRIDCNNQILMVEVLSF